MLETSTDTVCLTFIRWLQVGLALREVKNMPAVHFGEPHQIGACHVSITQKLWMIFSLIFTDGHVRRDALGCGPRGVA